MDKLARVSHILLPTDTPRWLHYAGRVTLGIIVLPLIVIVYPVAWCTVRLGQWLHARGEQAVAAWRVLKGP